MRAEQPTKLCKPQRKVGLKVRAPQNRFNSPPPPVIVTGRPKAVLSLRFHFFIIGVVQFLNVLILTILCVRVVCFSKDATCLGKSCRLGFSPVILLFVGRCLSIFPFDVWDKLWVLILSVPEISLLI